MGLRENREAGAHQMLRSENKTLHEEEREKIKERDERSLYTRWSKSSPGLDFGRSLTRHIVWTPRPRTSQPRRVLRPHRSQPRKAHRPQPRRAYRPQPRKVLRVALGLCRGSC